MNDAERLAWLEAQAAAAYGKMYDAGNPSDATALHGDAKEALHGAIALADALGQAATVQRLTARLFHIKAVFRSRFT